MGFREDRLLNKMKTFSEKVPFTFMKWSNGTFSEMGRNGFTIREITKIISKRNL